MVGAFVVPCAINLTIWKGTYAMKTVILLFALAIMTAPFAARTQTLATMTTGAVASDGEGGIFVLAGTDVSRYGINMRFAIDEYFDMGIQLAFDRLDARSFFGGGIDVKYHLPIETSDLPIHVALDAGIGDLESNDWRRIFLEAGFIVSGVIQSANRDVFEPYAGIYVMTTRGDWKGACDAGDSGCWDGARSDTDAVLRGGLRAHVTDDFQILVELNVNGDTMFGAGVNLIF